MRYRQSSWQPASCWTRSTLYYQPILPWTLVRLLAPVTELRSELTRIFHPKSPRIDNPGKRLKLARGQAGDLKPHKSSIENPGSSAKRHICGDDGVRKLVYQHNPIQLSCITDNTDSAAGSCRSDAQSPEKK